MKKVGINEFFEVTLRAKPKNKRWSWGAVDHRTNRVFLRLWNDNLKGDSGEKVVIYWKNKPAKERSQGYFERGKHVEAIKKGARGFGVICRARDPKEKPRTIASFEKDALVQLTALSEDERNVYARIKWMPISDLKLPARPKNRKSV